MLKGNKDVHSQAKPALPESAPNVPGVPERKRGAERRPGGARDPRAQADTILQLVYFQLRGPPDFRVPGGEALARWGRTGSRPQGTQVTRVTEQRGFYAAAGHGSGPGCSPVCSAWL